jgi:crotonobetainyl-CoA:carnitine CoA-transferase CaiB-like acyl-CoA transferase
MRQPRPQGQFSGTPAGIHRCSPELGEHTDEILTELGRNETEISQLRADKVVN